MFAAIVFAAVMSQPALDAAARTRWPRLDAATEQLLIDNRAQIDPAARRDWALDRALPMLAGELPANDEVIRDVLREISAASGSDLLLMEQARAAYAARDLHAAAERYARIAQASPLWPQALRERAWTLVLLGRPNDALGATVSLKAPYFPAEDHVEGRLMRATVLLQRCRFEEARAEIAPLADVPLESLAEGDAVRALQTGSVPVTPLALAAWNAPLVVRARAAFDGSDRLRALALHLLTQAFTSESEAVRAVRERALRIRYESLRTELAQVESGVVAPRITRAAPAMLDDDEVAWSFDGTFWRDELGTYRYAAADVCPRTAR